MGKYYRHIDLQDTINKLQIFTQMHIFTDMTKEQGADKIYFVYWILQWTFRYTTVLKYYEYYTISIYIFASCFKFLINVKKKVINNLLYIHVNICFYRRLSAKWYENIFFIFRTLFIFKYAERKFLTIE